MAEKIIFTGAVSCIACGQIEAAITDEQRGYQYFNDYTALREVAATPSPILQEGICSRCRPHQSLRGVERNRRKPKNKHASPKATMRN